MGQVTVWYFLVRSLAVLAISLMLVFWFDRWYITLCVVYVSMLYLWTNSAYWELQKSLWNLVMGQRRPKQKKGTTNRGPYKR